MLLKRFTFIVSLIAFLYFAYLFTLFITGTEMPETGADIHQLIMFPLIIATAVFLVISIVLVVRERFNLRSTNFYSLILLLVAVIIIFMLLKGYIELDS
jgi:hypothetical protein